MLRFLVWSVLLTSSAAFIHHPLQLQCRLLKSFRGSLRGQDGILTRTRRTGPTMLEKGEDDKGFFGGFFDMFSGSSDSLESEAAKNMLIELTRPGGWDLKMLIGSDEARKLGGTGKLAKGDVMTVKVGVKIVLDRDEGYFPPQGTVYVTDSLYFKEQDGGVMRGLWKIEEEDADGNPSTVSMSLKCPEGIKVSGDDLLAPGFVYANMRMASTKGGGLRLYDGRVTVKEDLGSSFLFTPYNGLIAEYKLVGTCEATPREERTESSNARIQ